MLPAEGFVHHVGSMAGLGTDYLPPRFVELVVSYRYPILLLVVALFAIALVFPRLSGGGGRDPRRLLLPAALFQATAMFFLAIPFHQIPDEVFVSLIQSRNLGETGRYSFYPDRNVDGTGDGLFYIATGGLHAAGIPAPLGGRYSARSSGRRRSAFSTDMRSTSRAATAGPGARRSSRRSSTASAASPARAGRRRCSRSSRSRRCCSGALRAGR